MPDFADEAAAAEAVRDPSTSSAEIATIAGLHPDLWADIAAHPAASPTVLESLSALGDEDVRQAVAARTDHGAPIKSGGKPQFAPPDATQQVAIPTAPPPTDVPKRTRWQWPVIAIVALLVVGVGVGSRFFAPAAKPPIAPPSTSVSTPMSSATYPIQIQVNEQTPTGSGTTTGPDVITYTFQVNPATTQLVQAPPVLTLTQFTDLSTAIWPQTSGRPAMQVSSPTYYNCSAAMDGYKASMLATAVENTASFDPHSSLRMTVFDTVLSAAHFRDKLKDCFAEMGTPVAAEIVIATSYQTTPTPSVYIMTLAHQATGPVQVICLHQWNNVVLMSNQVLDYDPDGTDPATQMFAYTLAPAFDQAVTATGAQHTGG